MVKFYNNSVFLPLAVNARKTVTQADVAKSTGKGQKRKAPIDNEPDNAVQVTATTGKRQRKRKQNEDAVPAPAPEIKKRNQKLNYRANIGTVFKLLRGLKLTEKHKQQIRKTPFWAIIEALLSPSLFPSWCRCYNSIVMDIVKLYNKSKNAFQIGETYVKFRNIDVKLIFGIDCGKKPLISKQITRKSDLDYGFYHRRCANVNRLDYPALCKMLAIAVKGRTAVDHEDVARILTLILCLKLLLPTKCYTIGWNYLHFVDDMEKMKIYDWVDAINENLMSSIRKGNKDPNQVSG